MAISSGLLVSLSQLTKCRDNVSVPMLINWFLRAKSFEIKIKKHKVYFQKMCFRMLSTTCWSFWSGLNVMMTSSNGNIFRVTGPFWGESTGYRWIHLTKASDAELWCFLWSANGWANNRDAGDLRRHRVHYDVTVMVLTSLVWKSLQPCIRHVSLSSLKRTFPHFEVFATGC